MLHIGELKCRRNHSQIGSLKDELTRFYDTSNLESVKSFHPNCSEATLRGDYILFETTASRYYQGVENYVTLLRKAKFTLMYLAVNERNGNIEHIFHSR